MTRYKELLVWKQHGGPSLSIPAAATPKKIITSGVAAARNREVSLPRRSAFLLAAIMLACSNPSAPEFAEIRPHSACMAWVEGGIICCDIDEEGGACIYYPPASDA